MPAVVAGVLVYAFLNVPAVVEAMCSLSLVPDIFHGRPVFGSTHSTPFACSML
jgi:hypothetical protein